jgi:hypothetical protein
MIFRSKKTDHTSKLDHTARDLSQDELALVSGGGTLSSSINNVVKTIGDAISAAARSG